MIGFLVSLILPWIIGISWLKRFWQYQSVTALLGYGYVVGIVITTLFMRFWDLVGLQQNFWVMALCLALIAIIPSTFVRTTPPIYQRENVTNVLQHPQKYLRWENLVFITFLVLITYRLLLIGYDNLLRLMFPWDAWRSYAPIAKIWFESKELVDFAPSRQWFTGAGADSPYARMLSSSKPVTSSLIMLWSALGLDTWRDDLIKLPWALSGAALTLGIYGQFRTSGVRRHLAILFVYLLISIPYINIHLLLAGYSEIWVATLLCFSFFSFLRWHEDGSTNNLILSILLAASCALFKNPGLVLGMLMVVAIAVDRLSPKLLWSLGGISVASTMVIWFTEGISLSVLGGPTVHVSPDYLEVPLLGKHVLGFTDVTSPILYSLLSSANWHLLWYGIVILMVIGVFKPGLRRLPAGGVFFFVASIGFLLFIFFLVPNYASQAFEKTTLNRALVLIAPTIYIFMVWWVFSVPRISIKINSPATEGQIAQ